MNLIKKILGLDKPSEADKIIDDLMKGEEKENKRLNRLNVVLKNADIELTVKNFDKVVKELNNDN